MTLQLLQFDEVGILLILSCLKLGDQVLVLIFEFNFHMLHRNLLLLL